METITRFIDLLKGGVRQAPNWKNKIIDILNYHADALATQ